MTSLFDLTGSTVVITGSTQGMSPALAAAGVDLVLLDQNEAGIQATAHDIRQLGQKALPIACDVTDVDRLDRVFTTVDREFGGLDILGNEAGEAKMGAGMSAA